jgi:sodium/potassium-transporting ATPase subunit alpha
MPIERLQKHWQVSADQGLSNDEVQRRTQQYGKNIISPPPSQWFGKIFGYFFKGFGAILLVGSILVFISWQPLGDPDPEVSNLALAIVLLAVFFIQAAFNAWQDWTSSRVMASITAMLPESCLVLRNGAQTTVSATQLVPGDIIYIKAGNKLPADVRLIEASNDSSFDRSILTGRFLMSNRSRAKANSRNLGESLPVNGAVDSTDDNYLETHCIGLQGTHCVAGTAIGLVVSTADSTIFGQIAKLSGEPKTGLTTLEREVLRFVALICLLMLTMIILVIIVWYIVSPFIWKAEADRLLGPHIFESTIPIISMCLLSLWTASVWLRHSFQKDFPLL